MIKNESLHIASNKLGRLDTLPWLQRFTEFFNGRFFTPLIAIQPFVNTPEF